MSERPPCTFCGRGAHWLATKGCPMRDEGQGYGPGYDCGDDWEPLANVPADQGAREARYAEAINVGRVSSMPVSSGEARTCVVFECGNPQATLGPCQEHLGESIAEEDRRAERDHAETARLQAEVGRLTEQLFLTDMERKYQTDLARTLRRALDIGWEGIQRTRAQRDAAESALLRVRELANEWRRAYEADRALDHGATVAQIQLGEHVEALVAVLESALAALDRPAPVSSGEAGMGEVVTAIQQAWIDHTQDHDHADPLRPRSRRCACGQVFDLWSLWVDHRWQALADAALRPAPVVTPSAEGGE
jgi:hypothetical protein